MTGIMGKPKDDGFSKEAAKEMAVRAIKKKLPLVPKRKIRNTIDALDKSLSQGKKRGIRF